MSKALRALGIAKDDVCVSFEKVPGDLSLAEKLKWRENWSRLKP